MAEETEIEKKYRVRSLPGDLEKFPCIEIEQSYLNRGGSPIRLRKFVYGINDIKYIFSKKVRLSGKSIRCVEHNVALTEEIYNNLLDAREGNVIRKTRYIVPLEDGLHIDLDVFHGFFEGVCIAEIEFKSEVQASNYCIPDWLEDIESSDKLSNKYMATKASNIEEYAEFIVDSNEK